MLREYTVGTMDEFEHGEVREEFPYYWNTFDDSARWRWLEMIRREAIRDLVVGFLDDMRPGHGAGLRRRIVTPVLIGMPWLWVPLDSTWSIDRVDPEDALGALARERSGRVDVMLIAQVMEGYRLKFHLDSWPEFVELVLRSNDGRPYEGVGRTMEVVFEMNVAQRDAVWWYIKAGRWTGAHSHLLELYLDVIRRGFSVPLRRFPAPRLQE